MSDISLFWWLLNVQSVPESEIKIQSCERPHLACYVVFAFLTASDVPFLLRIDTYNSVHAGLRGTLFLRKHPGHPFESTAAKYYDLPPVVVQTLQCL